MIACCEQSYVKWPDDISVRCTYRARFLVTFYVLDKIAKTMSARKLLLCGIHKNAIIRNQPEDFYSVHDVEATS